jgi:hypothetical protein
MNEQMWRMLAEIPKVSPQCGKLKKSKENIGVHRKLGYGTCMLIRFV